MAGTKNILPPYAMTYSAPSIFLPASFSSSFVTSLTDDDRKLATEFNAAILDVCIEKQLIPLLQKKGKGA
jgi:hypothetical protein